MSNSVADQSLGSGTVSQSTYTTVQEKEADKLFEIDFIGNESYVNSQRNVLLSRSVEPVGTSSMALLSARGLHHRSREYFEHDEKEATAVIRNMMKEDKAARKLASRLHSYLHRTLLVQLHMRDLMHQPKPDKTTM